LNPSSGTVTFLFSDIEGSTQLLQQLGAYETCTLGKVKFHQGDLVAAAKFLGRSKTHCEAVGSPWTSANTLCQSGHVWQAGGEYLKSTHAYAESIMPVWERREFERLSTQVRSDVGDDVIAKGRHLSTIDAVELASKALAAIGRSYVSPVWGRMTTSSRW